MDRSDAEKGVSLKPTINDALRWIGSRVDDVKGASVGRLDDVWVDPINGHPRWLLIKEGRFGGRHTLLPFEHASSGEGRVSLPYERDVVRSAPEVKPGVPLSAALEQELRHHYSQASAQSGMVGDPRYDRLEEEEGGIDPGAELLRDASAAVTGTDTPPPKTALEVPPTSVDAADEQSSPAVSDSPRPRETAARGVTSPPPTPPIDAPPSPPRPSASKPKVSSRAAAASRPSIDSFRASLDQTFSAPRVSRPPFAPKPDRPLTPPWRQPQAKEDQIRPMSPLDQAWAEGDASDAASVTASLEGLESGELVDIEIVGRVRIRGEVRSLRRAADDTPNA